MRVTYLLMAHKPGISRINLPLPDMQVWKDFRAAAIKRNIELANAAQEALRDWVRKPGAASKRKSEN